MSLDNPMVHNDMFLPYEIIEVSPNSRIVSLVYKGTRNQVVKDIPHNEARRLVKDRIELISLKDELLFLRGG